MHTLCVWCISFFSFFLFLKTAAAQFHAAACACTDGLYVSPRVYTPRILGFGATLPLAEHGAEHPPKRGRGGGGVNADRGSRRGVPTSSTSRLLFQAVSTKLSTFISLASMWHLCVL